MPFSQNYIRISEPHVVYILLIILDRKTIERNFMSF